MSELLNTIEGLESEDGDGADKGAFTASAIRQWSAFRAYRKSLVLLLVALVAGFAAMVAFPSDSPVSPRRGLSEITIGTSYTPYWAGIWLSHKPSPAGTDIKVALETVTPESALATVQFLVPSNTWGGPTRCAPHVRCSASAWGKEVQYTLPNRKSTVTTGQRYYWQAAEFVVPNLEYNASSNDEYVSATIPHVSFYRYMPGDHDGTHYQNENVPTTITMSIRHLSQFSWTNGSMPASTNGESAAWSYSNLPGATQVASGTSLPVQDENSKLLFIAGALLGIAGGALVGAIQEAIRA